MHHKVELTANFQWIPVIFSLVFLLQCVPRRISPIKILSPIIVKGELQGTVVIYQDGIPVVDSLVWLTYSMPGETLHWYPIVTSKVLDWIFDPEIQKSLYSWDSTHASWFENEKRIYLYLAEESTFVTISSVDKHQLVSSNVPIKISAPSRPGIYKIHIEIKQVWVVEGKEVPNETLYVYANTAPLLGVFSKMNPLTDSVVLGVPIGTLPSDSEILSSQYTRAHRWVYRDRPNLVPVWEPKEESLLVSPHFTLGEFLCHEPKTYPRLFFVHPRLLRKLELFVIESRIENLTIMSGYRTPLYNASLGNGKFSMHVYGRAADVYVDGNGDGVMDDLNGDGKIGIADARLLAGLFQNIEKFRGMAGGIGIYDWNTDSTRTPFVHIDVRGFKARW